MIAYTSETGPQIWPSVDYINIMSYDLMNRRDNVTQHHTSVVGSEDTIKNYLDIGAPPSKINLGFAYYAKYFTTAGDCSASPLGCPIKPPRAYSSKEKRAERLLPEHLESWYSDLRAGPATWSVPRLGRS